MAEDAFAKVKALLVEQQGIGAESIHPGSRLIEDLGMWGDDVVEFLEAVAAELGTDLAALRSDWRSHFPPEAQSWTHILIGFPIVVLSGIIAGLSAVAAGMPELWVAPIAVVLMLALLWLASRVVRSPEWVPVTVADVAAAVARGRWESAL